MNKMRRAVHRLVDVVFPLLRAGYYRLGFGRNFPLYGRLARLVYIGEVARGNGDVPKGQEDWDADYRTNVWTYMAALEEVSRYAVIAGYITYLKRGSCSLLDVGCGEGVLLDRLRPHGYIKYVGVDVSNIAVAKLIRKQDPKTVFLQADAETFQPTEAYDVIVFNEALYYFHAPLDTLKRYVRFLRPDGILIISTYALSKRASAILRSAKALFNLVDETRTTQGPRFWICTVLQPRVRHS